MEPAMLSFVPENPFKASIQYSIKNTFLGSSSQPTSTMDDVAPPSIHVKTRRRPYPTKRTRRLYSEPKPLARPQTPPRYAPPSPSPPRLPPPILRYSPQLPPQPEYTPQPEYFTAPSAQSRSRLWSPPPSPPPRPSQHYSSFGRHNEYSSRVQFYPHERGADAVMNPIIIQPRVVDSHHFTGPLGGVHAETYNDPVNNIMMWQESVAAAHDNEGGPSFPQRSKFADRPQSLSSSRSYPSPHSDSDSSRPPRRRAHSRRSPKPHRIWNSQSGSSWTTISERTEPFLEVIHSVPEAYDNVPSTPTLSNSSTPTNLSGSFHTADTHLPQSHSGSFRIPSNHCTASVLEVGRRQIYDDVSSAHSTVALEGPMPLMFLDTYDIAGGQHMQPQYCSQASGNMESRIPESVLGIVCADEVSAPRVSKLSSPRSTILSGNTGSHSDEGTSKRQPTVENISTHSGSTVDGSPLPSAILYILVFILDTLPRQLYLYFLLRLPYLYFSRVIRIFEEAETSILDIKQGILEAALDLDNPHFMSLEPPSGHTSYSRLHETWNSFIDSLLREWKTLNIISVLLLSAILTILQIESAANDPLTRYTALLSMICALMSLLYGCMYIIRFSTMRKPYKAAEWVNEAQKSRTGIFWNVWVLLAMPAAWLVWSMILYVICVMSFVWRTGTINDASQDPMTDKQVFPARIILSGVLLLGLVYFTLIIATLRQYGDTMDRAWRERIRSWSEDYLNENRHAMPSVATERLERMSSAAASSVQDRMWQTDVSKVESRTRRRKSPKLKARKSRSKYFVSLRSLATNPFAWKDTARGVIASTKKAASLETLIIRRQTGDLQNIDDDRGSSVEDQNQMPTEAQELSCSEHLFELHSFDENQEILMLGIPGASIVAMSGCQQRRSRTGRSSPDRHILQFDYGPKHIKMFRILSLHPGIQISWKCNSKTFPLSEEQSESLQSEIQASWNENQDPESILPVLQRWNETLPMQGGQIALCKEFGDPSLGYAAYYFETQEILPRNLDLAVHNLDTIPSILQSLHIWPLSYSLNNLSHTDDQSELSSLNFARTNLSLMSEDYQEKENEHLAYDGDAPRSGQLFSGDSPTQYSDLKQSS